MRYIRKITESEGNGVQESVFRIVEYTGKRMGDTWYINNGWTAYEGSLPVDRLDIVNGAVVELPEPEPVNKYKEWYKANPDLIKRVQEYKFYLNMFGLPPTATTDQIALDIQASSLSDSEKVQSIFLVQTAFNNVVLNLEYLGIDRPQYTAWAEMSYLIVNLPTT